MITTLTDDLKYVKPFSPVSTRDIYHDTFKATKSPEGTLTTNTKPSTWNGDNWQTAKPSMAYQVCGQWCIFGTVTVDSFLSLVFI